MKIAMACDHGGLRLKNVLKDYLEANGYIVEDFGTYSEDSCDYPDYAGKAAKAVASGSCDRGVVVCGTGIGVSTVSYTHLISMPAAVPPAVARSFESLTPTVIIILGVSTITMWLGINVHTIVGNLIKPLINATDTLPSTLLILSLIHI